MSSFRPVNHTSQSTSFSRAIMQQRDGNQCHTWKKWACEVEGVEF